ILMQKFIDLPHWKSKAEWQREFPWIGARRINYDDDWSPGESLYGWVGDPIKKLFDRAISLGYSEDAPNLEEKSSALVGLNKLIKWAKSEIPEEVEALENGQKVKPEDVIAEFREGRKPDGEILTVPYLIKSVDWPDFKNSKQFSDATDAKLLTRWIKVGRAYAYLYTELSAMSRGDSMKDGA
ncbi:MAG TPA: hypothetical protein PLY87_10340, partial [Planctomycetaceae bacterium]|nr:hypothetical protein [Planctomycetaceae bacterium]